MLGISAGTSDSVPFIYLQVFPLLHFLKCAKILTAFSVKCNHAGVLNKTVRAFINCYILMKEAEQIPEPALSFTSSSDCPEWMYCTMYNLNKNWQKCICISAVTLRDFKKIVKINIYVNYARYLQRNFSHPY